MEQYDRDNIAYFNCQEVEDEHAYGMQILKGFIDEAKDLKREDVDFSELCIGLKCGGSDGFSGITANPLVGRFCDRLVAYGGSCALTEVPEMFGAEHLLMNRAESPEIFEKTVFLINNFKEYYERHDQVIYENPSPGNKKGGITTLEEKSLGCVQKGGLSPVVDVLGYGERLVKNGLSLVNGPGNDIVACTNLLAAGVHMILFTTGRGTPLGSAVPTLKIATNKSLAERKSAWIDFDASPILDGIDPTDALFDLVIETANGKPARNEENGCEEIAIFKTGVTL